MRRLFTVLLSICWPTAQLFAQSADSSLRGQSLLVYGVIVLLSAGVIVLLIVFRPRPLPRIEDDVRFQELKTETEGQKQRIAALLASESAAKESVRDYQAAAKTRDDEVQNLSRSVAEYKAKEAQAESDRKNESVRLENARKALEDERQRVVAEEQRRRQEEADNRDRIWATHETESILKMKDVCQKPHLLVTNFDNTGLPEDFDPALKPDFMVKLMDQYVVFDPKLSKQDNLQTYLATQAKRTADKFRKSPSFELLYKSAFFVVPAASLQFLRQIAFFEQGFMFYVIPVESFEPILTALKRIEEYDLADKYDPQERENVVNLIATFEQHIRQENASHILSALRGLRALSEKDLVPEDVASAIEAARKAIRTSAIRPTDLKRLMENPQMVVEEIARLLKDRRKALPDADPTELPTPARPKEQSG